MLKPLLASSLLLLFLVPQAMAFSLPAVGLEDSPVELTAEEPIEAIVNAKSSVELGKNIIFDASQTLSVVPQEELSFEWFFGDGNRQQGVEVVHSYIEAGQYEVTLVVRDSQGRQSSILQDVFVYEHSFALITDVESERERIEGFVESAQNENVFVSLIESYSSKSEFLAEEDLKSQLSENLSGIENNDILLVWTQGSSGLTVFSQLQKSLSDPNFFRGKDIIFVTDQYFDSLSNIARGVFQSIQPNQIILTRSESVWALPDVEDAEAFKMLLEERGIQYAVVDDTPVFRPWNFMSSFVNTMIDKGVPSNTIRLVLMLPVIVTVVAFMKQVVGLATLGVYTPSILALSFIALDLSYGLLILFAILFIGTLTRLFLRRYRLLYIPRMAIVLTLVSLTILFLLYLGAIFNISALAGIAVFPMLIMSTMVEKFVSIQSGKGLRSALTLVGEAVLVAILCYYVAEWSWLKVVVLGHPEIIFLFLLSNIALARWSGLRLLEYVRFREIIRHAEE